MRGWGFAGQCDVLGMAGSMSAETASGWRDRMVSAEAAVSIARAAVRMFIHRRPRCAGGGADPAHDAGKVGEIAVVKPVAEHVLQEVVVALAGLLGH